MTTPRDPLQNATLSVPESERIVSSVPEAYRLAYHPECLDFGKLYVLQGAFRSWNDQGMLEFEWRDIPTVGL